MPSLRAGRSRAPHSDACCYSEHSASVESLRQMITHPHSSRQTRTHLPTVLSRGFTSGSTTGLKSSDASWRQERAAVGAKVFLVAWMYFRSL